MYEETPPTKRKKTNITLEPYVYTKSKKPFDFEGDNSASDEDKEDNEKNNYDKEESPSSTQEYLEEKKGIKVYEIGKKENEKVEGKNEKKVEEKNQNEKEKKKKTVEEIEFVDKITTKHALKSKQQEKEKEREKEKENVKVDGKNEKKVEEMNQNEKEKKKKTVEEIVFVDESKRFFGEKQTTRK